MLVSWVLSAWAVREQLPVHGGKGGRTGGGHDWRVCTGRQTLEGGRGRRYGEESVCSV